MKIVGEPLPRVDAKPKVTGRALFVDDIKFANMLYIRVVRCPHPHAKIISIDLEEAKRLNGVEAILTAKDIPGKNAVPLVYQDQPFIAESEVMFSGEPVAIIAATLPYIARRAEKLLKIKYENLPTVIDPREAMKPEAPRIYKDDNIIVHYKTRKGISNNPFNNSESVIIEGRYTTPHQEHAYIEPQGVLSYLGPNGNIKVMGSMQCPFYVQSAVAQILGLSLNEVEVEQAVTGGGFGGKEDVPSILAGLSALITYKTGRPAKLILDREEDIKAMSKRHPAFIHYRTSSDKTGKLLGVEVEYILNAGAYSSLSTIVAWRGAIHALGPYNCEYVKVDVYAAATNTVPNGAFRGFGTPQIIFAHERQMDRLAVKLNIDPIEIRKINALREGHKTATDQALSDSVSFLKTIEKAEEISEWHLKKNKPQKNETQKRGLGVSSFIYGVGLGAGGAIYAKAASFVQITKDGGVIVAVGTTEMGQGMKTVLSQIAAQELGVNLDKVHFLEANTSRVPDSGPTVASRATLMSGNSIIDACIKLKQNLLPVAVEVLELPPENIEFFDEKVGNNKKNISFMELIDKAYKKRVNLTSQGWFCAPECTYDMETGLGSPYFTYAFGTIVSEVDVDINTGQVDVLRLYCVHDVGKAINPQTAEGQIQGGALQGMGYGVFEEIIFPEGIIKNADFSTYIIPTAMDAPEIIPVLVEEAYKGGPYGAKGLGEPSLMGVAASISNAVSNAIKRDVFSLPVKGEYVWNLLNTTIKEKVRN